MSARRPWSIRGWSLERMDDRGQAALRGVGQADSSGTDCCAGGWTEDSHGSWRRWVIGQNCGGVEVARAAERCTPAATVAGTPPVAVASHACPLVVRRPPGVGHRVACPGCCLSSRVAGIWAWKQRLSTSPVELLTMLPSVEKGLAPTNLQGDRCPTGMVSRHLMTGAHPAWPG